MALATQCPFCQTTFRVAQDQLKLRGGLVRCGNCREVFDGNANLLPVDISQQLLSVTNNTAAASATPSFVPTATAPDVVPEPSEVTASAVPPAQTPPALPPRLPAVDLSATFASIAAQTSDAPWGTGEEASSSDSQKSTSELDASTIGTLTQELDFPQPPAQPISELPTPAANDEDNYIDLAAAATPTPHSEVLPVRNSWRNIAAAAADDSLQEENAKTIAPASATLAEETRELFSETVSHDVSDKLHADEPYQPQLDSEEYADHQIDDAPGFVQRAERRERIRAIAAILLAIGSGVLALGLLLQATYLWRNQIASLLPATRPWLAAACAPLHCAVGLPTNIEQLVLDSSELQRIPPHQNIYTLNLLLRNRGYSAQAWPYIELTLNDTDEKAIIRRVFTPREYLASPQQVNDGLAGNGEQSVKLTFELSQAPASGYHLYLFYP